MPVIMQKLSKMRCSAVQGATGRASRRMAASKASRVALVLAAALAAALTAAPANAADPTTPFVSTSTSETGSGSLGNGTTQTLTATFSEAPVLASSYSLTLADGSSQGILSNADGNLSANVSGGNTITFNVLGAPIGGGLTMSSPLEVISATGISDASGNPWNLPMSGQVDKYEVLSAGDSVTVTFDKAVTVESPTNYSLTLEEGAMSATINNTDTNASGSGTDTITYSLTGDPTSGVVPTDPPTVTALSGLSTTPTTPYTAATTADVTSVAITVDADTTCGNISGYTRVFGGTNCDISNSGIGRGPLAPDVYDVIPIPTDDLPGPNPTNGDPSGDDNAPEVITNCGQGSTDTVYDVNTGAELGQALCGTGDPGECDIGNTCSDTLDYIATPNLGSFEEVGVVETLPGSTYVSPTAVPPQLSGITLSGDQATFSYYTDVGCQAGSGFDPDTLAQFSYTSPYTDEVYNDRTWPTSYSCSSWDSGSTTITVTFGNTNNTPIPSTGVRFKFAGYGPGHFVIGAQGSSYEYEREASESAYVGPSATIGSFIPQSTTLTTSAGGSVGITFATTGALNCTLGAISNPTSAASLSLPTVASCNGTGTITVPANTSSASSVTYTVTLTAQGVAGTPPANSEITITVPAAPASSTSSSSTSSSSTPRPSTAVVTLSLLKIGLKKLKSGVKFTFSATSVATGYECALVRLPVGKKKGKHHLTLHYAACSATQVFNHLKNGHYELFVRAVGPSGVSSALTKKFTFTATTTKKHHG